MNERSLGVRVMENEEDFVFFKENEQHLQHNLEQYHDTEN